MRCFGICVQITIGPPSWPFLGRSLTTCKTPYNPKVASDSSERDGQSTVIARALADYAHALEAIRSLETAGVDSDDISVITRSPGEADRLEHATGASGDLEDSTRHRHHLADFVDWLGQVEAVVVPGFGSILGSGNLWQDVSPSAGDRGAITGALVGLGLPVDEAAGLEDAVFDGHILVVVHGPYDPITVSSALDPTQDGSSTTESVG